MSTPERIRVLIVDDHNMVRTGLRAYLRQEADMEVVGEARNGQQALELCEEAQPDVILMDLIMPELSGAEATRIIRRQWPQIQVIALTSFQRQELVQDALQAGAIGYLLKNVSGEDLAAAIRSAYAGRSTLAPEAVEALIQMGKPKHTPGDDLTPREREVLPLLVEGLSNAEIADRLVVSRSTVKVHVSNILSKLHASNRGEAVALAIQHKLVP
jgi:NarL family two-component system response regulator LiaR